MLRAFIILTALSFLGACKSHTVIDEYRAAESFALDKHDAIAILGRRHSDEYETEHDFIECIGARLSANGNKVIPEKQFLDSLYPYFETSTAPTDVNNIGKLIHNPLIAKKFEELNLRYFIWIEGSTETTDRAGSISCTLGPGGCIGYLQWDDEANYEAKIWDYRRITVSGKVRTETRGSSFMPAIIIPIPMLARVQATACETLSNQIKSFFSEST